MTADARNASTERTDRILELLDVGLQTAADTSYPVPAVPGDIDYEGPEAPWWEIDADDIPETEHDLGTLLTLTRQAAEAMANLEEHSTYSAPDDGRPWGLTRFAYNDTNEGYIDESNFHAALRELSEVDEAVFDVTMKHWVGSIREYIVAIPLDNVAVVDAYASLIDQVESYPVLDEMDLYQREAAAWRRELTWEADVDDDNVDAVAAWLGEHHDIWRADDVYGDDADLGELVREALVALGLVEPEEDEEGPSALELTRLALGAPDVREGWQPPLDFHEGR